MTAMASRFATRVAVITGVVFVVASLPKLVAYHWEVENFARFGLPVPGAWVVAAGVIELVGGSLLIARRWVAGSSLVLAVTMAVAIVVSGIRHGDIIPSLTLAPALLVACVYLMASAKITALRRRGPEGPRAGHGDR